MSKQEEGKEGEAKVVQLFRGYCSEQKEVAVAVAAIQALTDVVKSSGAATMMGLEVELRDAADALKEHNPLSISLAAGCELFNRYVTRTSLELVEFERCKERLIERGEQFSKMSLIAREKISVYGNRFIRDGQTLLLHGTSRVVLQTLKKAVENGKRFSVLLTEGRSDPKPRSTFVESLLALNIPVTVILDATVAYIMERVDLVLVGSEAVVESGGIINQSGTLTMALCAHALNTPVYVAAESYKFARLFPLTQADIHAPTDETLVTAPLPKGVLIEAPRLDYTPPEYITLLFTDLGILTPSAVSDELIKLYN